MKRLFLILMCICILAAASVVSAQDAGGYKVTYKENNCLASVPVDEKTYQQGEQVTVLFDPVTYMNGLIFYGWDMNNDGIADFGYAYDKFYMPGKDVELKAICISPYYEAPNPCPNPCPPPHHHHDHGQRPGPAPVDPPTPPAPPAPPAPWQPWVDPSWPSFYPIP